MSASRSRERSQERIHSAFTQPARALEPRGGWGRPPEDTARRGLCYLWTGRASRTGESVLAGSLPVGCGEEAGTCGGRVQCGEA